MKHSKDIQVSTMTRVQKASIGGVVAAALLGSGIQGVGAQAFPNQPIRLIIPFGAGSATDITARQLEPVMTRSLGQPVVIENRAGAVGMIGAEVVKRARPDGYTMLYTAASHSIQAVMRPKSLPLDVVRDFTMVGRAYTSSGMIAVNPSVPARNLKELIEYSKTLPGGLNFAAGGVGSSHHLQGEALKGKGANVVLVSYVKIAQGISDTVGGHVPMIVYATASLAPHVRSGRLRAIAVNSEKRQPALPDVPTINEQGFKGTGAGGWNGMMGPAALPPEIRTRLYAALVAAVTDPQVAKAAASAGLEEGLLPGDEFRAFLESDIAMWGDVVKHAKLPLDHKSE